MRIWELARYALENTWRSRLRTVLTIAGIAIAIGALVSMVGFVLGLRLQIETPVRKLGMLSNIEVRSQEQESDQAGSSSASPVLDDAMLQRIEKLDGVDFVYPDFRLSEIHLSRDDDNSCSAYAIGIPREATLLGFSQDLLVTGRFFSLGDEMELILGEQLVPQLGFAMPASVIGQNLSLSTGGLVAKESKQFEFQREELLLTVVGVYRPPGFATDIGGDSVLLPVDVMRKMPTNWMEGGLRQLRSRNGEVVKGFPQVIVRAESPTDVLRVEKRVKELGFSTRSVMDRMADMRRFFVFMEILLSAVGTVALVVAGLGIFNTLLMTVMERYQEIGIYKSIGASSGDIRCLFLVEAAVVGLGGGIAGLGLAHVVSWVLGWAFNAYAASQGVDGPMAVFVFPWWLLLGAVVYAILISIVSGLYPASRAANVDPIQALRGN